jgi:hypothetical protein
MTSWPAKISLTILIAISPGCLALHHAALGTRVHAFSVKGRDYVHCSILVDRAQPEMAKDAIQVCEDGVNQHLIQPQPESPPHVREQK